MPRASLSQNKTGHLMLCSFFPSVIVCVAHLSLEMTALFIYLFFLLFLRRTADGFAMRSDPNIL